MIGQTFSHYEILEKLGEGGMGVVYKARDTKLDRAVALKFLPRHFAANDKAAARLLQEAKAVAALNHPNICIIHAIEEAEGEQFIVMEYVDGQTLDQKTVGADGRPLLQVNEAISFAIQIGGALNEAHGKGIVHRDVKSENIMVNSKNQIKVMDFGLAKLKGSLKLTKTMSTLGTLAYMAPEQIRGEEVDARSDIFSFGVVLFEMLTGQLPFRGEHEAAMMYSILQEEPKSVTSVRADAPKDFDRIIKKSLAKLSVERYQHMDELIADIVLVQRGSLPKSSQPEQTKEGRRLSAIMFTDMVGYSALTQRNELLAIQLLEEHRGILRPLFPNYGGREIETVGDAFFVEFSSALEAFRCAVAMQEALFKRNSDNPDNERIRIRIGIHLGDVVYHGPNVLGDGVNIAARVEPLAEPEGICVSEDVARQVQNKTDIPLRKLGEKQLKNIQMPVAVYAVQLPWLTKPAGSETAVVHVQTEILHPKADTALEPSQEVAVTRVSPRRIVAYSVIGLVPLAIGAYFLIIRPAQQTLTSSQLENKTVPVQKESSSKATVRVETLRVKETAQPPQIVRKENTGKPKSTAIAETIKQTPQKVETPPPDLLANADSIYAIAVAKYKAGDLVGAKAACEEALALYTTAKSNRDIGKARRTLAMILLYQDNLSASKQMFGEAESALQRAGENESAALAALGSARVLLEQKKFDEAETNLDQIISKNTGSNASAGACGLLAHLALTRGNTDEAQKQLQEADRRQTRGKDGTVDMLVETAHARCDAALGKTVQEMKQEMQVALSRASDVASDLEVKFVFAVIAAKHMKSDASPQQRFQRNPRRGAMQTIQQRFETVRSEAYAKGFTLIARKASEVLQR